MGILPSRDTCTSLYIVGKEREQDAEASCLSTSCLAKFAEGVYILHAFRKKTQKTAKKDLDIARARFRDVIQHRTSQ